MPPEKRLEAFPGFSRLDFGSRIPDFQTHPMASFRFTATVVRTPGFPFSINIFIGYGPLDLTLHGEGRMIGFTLQRQTVFLADGWASSFQVRAGCQAGNFRCFRTAARCSSLRLNKP
jgi:hypothetical protein